MEGARGVPCDGLTSQHVAVSEADYVPKTRMRFRERVKSLVPFTEQFTFFTVAPAYLHGAFRDIVLWDFLALVGRPVDFYYAKFDRPLFRGLEAPDGDADWNHALWAVAKENWEDLANHICGAVLTDASKKITYRYAVQSLSVVDPLFLDRCIVCPADVPMLPIYAIGARTNQYCAAFELGIFTAMDLPELKFFPPDEQCKLYASVLFREDDPQTAMRVTEPKENPSESAL